jgi:transcription elongation factor Elf1
MAIPVFAGAGRRPVPENMLPFDANQQCPKCTAPAVDIVRTYCQYQLLDVTTKVDWLALKCGCCGYEFSMETADAKTTSQAKTAH